MEIRKVKKKKKKRFGNKVRQLVARPERTRQFGSPLHPFLFPLSPLSSKCVVVQAVVCSFEERTLYVQRGVPGAVRRCRRSGWSRCKSGGTRVGVVWKGVYRNRGVRPEPRSPSHQRGKKGVGRRRSRALAMLPCLL